MQKIFLSLGSNLENKLLNIKNALKQINENVGKTIKVSSCYETEPWGFNANDWFLNIAIELETDFNPNELLQNCMWIENNLGRKRNKTEVGYSSRTIDIDILFFGNEIINLPNLTIPHEHVHNRKFVLKPLCDIAPEFIHPTLKESIQSLLQKCTDKMELKRLDYQIEINNL
ncbi:MAG: 2-amino-4-hydroxy-6-hydroxymethyldihydropteridine diphosphokinase [Bacteroidota bacterium]